MSHSSFVVQPTKAFKFVVQPTQAVTLLQSSWLIVCEAQCNEQRRLMEDICVFGFLVIWNDLFDNNRLNLHFWFSKLFVLSLQSTFLLVSWQKRLSWCICFKKLCLKELFGDFPPLIQRCYGLLFFSKNNSCCWS